MVNEIKLVKHDPQKGWNSHNVMVYIDGVYMQFVGRINIQLDASEPIFDKTEIISLVEDGAEKFKVDENGIVKTNLLEE